MGPGDRRYVVKRKGGKTTKGGENTLGRTKVERNMHQKTWTKKREKKGSSTRRSQEKHPCLPRQHKYVWASDRPRTKRPEKKARTVTSSKAKILCFKHRSKLKNSYTTCRKKSEKWWERIARRKSTEGKEKGGDEVSRRPARESAEKSLQVGEESAEVYTEGRRIKTWGKRTTKADVGPHPQRATDMAQIRVTTKR